MSQQAFDGQFKAVVGIPAAIALFAAWTLATWLLEGRIETLLRPDMAGERTIYAIIANLLIGIATAVLVLHCLIRVRILSKRDAGFGHAAASPIWLAIAAGVGFALYALQGAPSWHPVVLTNVFAQVLVVSAAEVIVCWAVMGSSVEAWLRPRGRTVSLVSAALVASILFGVYHFAHSAPFNTLGMVVLLTAVGLLTSMFFFISRDVYATILFHNFLGLFGVTRVLAEFGQLHSLERLQPPLLGMAVLTIVVLAVSDWALLRRRRLCQHHG